MIRKLTETQPNGAPADGGRPIGAPPKAAPVFPRYVSDRFYIKDIYGYSLSIPYILHIYLLAM